MPQPMLGNQYIYPLGPAAGAGQDGGAGKVQRPPTIGEILRMIEAGDYATGPPTQPPGGPVVPPAGPAVPGTLPIGQPGIPGQQQHTELRPQGTMEGGISHYDALLRAYRRMMASQNNAPGRSSLGPVPPPAGGGYGGGGGAV